MQLKTVWRIIFTNYQTACWPYNTGPFVQQQNSRLNCSRQQRKNTEVCCNSTTHGRYVYVKTFTLLTKQARTLGLARTYLFFFSFASASVTCFVTTAILPIPSTSPSEFAGDELFLSGSDLIKRCFSRLKHVKSKDFH